MHRTASPRPFTRARQRTLALAALITAVSGVATGCGSDDSSAATVPETAVTSEIGVLQPPPAVGAGLTVGTSDACTIARAEHVVEAFGGDAAAGVADGNGGCAFALSGETVIGDLAGASALVTVMVSPDGYLGVDEQAGVLPDLEPIAGIGDEAWYTAFNRELHVNLGGTDLIVIGASGDATAGREAVLALGRAIVTDLELAAAAGGGDQDA